MSDRLVPEPEIPMYLGEPLNYYNLNGLEVYSLPNKDQDSERMPDLDDIPQPFYVLSQYETPIITRSIRRYESSDVSTISFDYPDKKWQLDYSVKKQNMGIPLMLSFPNFIAKDL